MKETLEAANRLYPVKIEGIMYMPTLDDLNNSYKQEAFIEGAKWQQERMYSEEDMRKSFETGRNFQLTGENNFKELIEQIKKQ